MPPRKRLGQLLMELKVIDEHQLQSALGHQKQWGGKLGGILVQKGFCSEDDMVSALTKHLGIPRVKLAELKVDPRALKCVSKPIAEKLHVLPYELSGSGRSEVVTIAMSDPTDLSAVDQLSFHTGKRVKTMLAGDSEIVAAILQHYGGPEEKKEATDKVARPAGANAAAPGAPAGSVAGGKRIDPPPPPAPGGRSGAPYIPPPIPAAKPPAPAQKLEEIEPDAAVAPPPAPAVIPESVDLPPDDGGDLGLEPIAAHSQFGDAIAGQEDVAGEGNAADAVEGLVSASLAHHGAGTATDGAASGAEQEALAWHAQVSAAQGWEAPATGAAPAHAPDRDQGWGATDPGQQPATGWTAPVLTRAPDTSALPGTGWTGPIDLSASMWAQESEPPPAPAAAPPAGGWDPAAPAQDTAWGVPAHEQAAEMQHSEALPTDAILGPPPSAADSEPDFSVDVEQTDLPAAPEESAAAFQADPPASEAAEPPPEPAEAAPETSETFPAEPSSDALAHEAEAPDAWAAADDPLATGEIPLDALASDAGLRDPLAPESPAWAGTDETAAEDAAVDAGDGATQEVADAAPPDQIAQAENGATQEVPAGLHQAQADAFGDDGLGSAIPLSPADLGTLSSIGVEPSDGVGALRLLAVLIRILNRNQMIEPDQLRDEIRESIEQGTAVATNGLGSDSSDAGAGALAET